MSCVSVSYTYKSASVRRNRGRYRTVSINRDFLTFRFVKTAIIVAKYIPFWGPKLDLRGGIKETWGVGRENFLEVCEHIKRLKE
jgi:hypothetical protein